MQIANTENRVLHTYQYTKLIKHCWIGFLKPELSQLQCKIQFCYLKALKQVSLVLTDGWVCCAVDDLFTAAATATVGIPLHARVERCRRVGERVQEPSAKNRLANCFCTVFTIHTSWRRRTQTRCTGYLFSLFTETHNSVTFSFTGGLKECCSNLHSVEWHSTEPLSWVALNWVEIWLISPLNNLSGHRELVLCTSDNFHDECTQLAS